MNLMKNLKIFGALLLMVLTMSVFTGCTKDDDEDNEELLATIVGTWHTYKFSGTVDGETREESLSKDGDYPELYMEVEFRKDNTITMSTTYPLSGKWVSIQGKYSISGNKVTLTDNDGDVVLTYDSSQKVLFYETQTDIDGKDANIKIFLKK